MPKPSFSSRLIADVGISMGDEGKGRLIPELVAELQEATGKSAPVGVVLKVNGGANSGHTAGGLKLNLMPAGVICASVPWLAMGAGVVADPRKARWETAYLAGKGYDIGKRLAIDERTMVSDLSHRLLDLAWEHYREHVLKETPRGSTGRGITPAYLDEVGQFQIYYGDYLGSKSDFKAKLTARLQRALAVIQHVCQVPADAFRGFFDTLSEAETRANAEAIEQGWFPASEFDVRPLCGKADFSVDADALTDLYWEAAQPFRDNIRDVREIILGELASRRYVIGEFGQSYWLDKRHGFPPNVTASHTYTAEIFQSAGIPVQPVHTIGCCKAYDTKVGTHVFLTQMEDAHPLTQKLKQLEFGTSTGRQRMVGWFDAVEKGDALRYGGYQDLVINKLDALTADHGGHTDLQICIGYQTPQGYRVNHVPRNDSERLQLQPVYETVPGWTECLSGIRTFAELPDNAKRYVAVCVRATLDIASREMPSTELPRLRYIGVGPDPSQIIKDAPATAELIQLAASARS